MIMKNHQKQSLLSLLGGIGLIVLLSGIFIDTIQFMDALFVALCIWIMTGVLSKFLGINRKGEFLNTDWKNGIVSFIGSIGIIILLAGIFLNVPFSYAIVLAIFFWVLSGATASFLNVKDTRHSSYKNYSSTNPHYTTPHVLTNEQDIQSSYSQFGQPSPKAHKLQESPAKNFCPTCGSSMYREDTFCSNCGSSLNSPF